MKYIDKLGRATCLFENLKSYLQIWPLKRLQRGSISLPPPCNFSKNLSSRERVKTCSFFCLNFNIIIRHIFLENFIEISQIVQKI